MTSSNSLSKNSVPKIGPMLPNNFLLSTNSSKEQGNNVEKGSFVINSGTTTTWTQRYPNAAGHQTKRRFSSGNTKYTAINGPPSPSISQEGTNIIIQELTTLSKIIFTQQSGAVSGVWANWLGRKIAPNKWSISNPQLCPKYLPLTQNHQQLKKLKKKIKNVMKILLTGSW